MLEFRLLGPVEAYAGTRRLDVGPRRQRLILGVLALEVNQPVPLDRLVELGWSASPPRTAAQALSTAGVAREGSGTGPERHRVCAAHRPAQR
jgi:DNA-binding SARP family transcriptional activator